jgi:hypothetical protein
MQASELSVQGQTLQTLYNFFVNGYLLVNRRYQRKLVWGVEEKQKLIDSVVNKLPIPLVLIAERPRGSSGKYEIIDGLQRLEAFFSFMDNSYDYDGQYFDLETIGDTKDRRDVGKIEQLNPRLSREVSLAIANYQIPVSIYREATTSSIDEVFRRINSGGRRLSLHEIRQAGSSGPLPDLVRRVSASIRGDGTFSEIVPFAEMKNLSISRKDLRYGLSIDDIFWVRHEILAQEDLRASSDEELVLDLILDIVLDQRPTTGWQNRDVAYGLPRKINTASLDDVNNAVAETGPDLLHQQTLAIVKLCDDVMAGHGSLGRHMIKLETYEKGTRRQFQAVFSALFELTFIHGLAPKSTEAVRSVLNDFWGKGLSIPTGGSAWGKQEKEKLYPEVRKKLRRAFYKPEPKKEYIRLNSRMYVDNLLHGHPVEHPLVEFKQGFCILEDVPIEDANLLDQVLATSSAMANHSRDAEGMVLIGVADKASDADRVRKLFGVEPVSICGRLAVGTEEQIALLGYDVDRWWRRWQQMIQTADMNSDFRRALAMSLKPIYCDNLILWELRPKSIGKPLTYAGKFYVRVGSSTEEVSADEFLGIVSQW